MSDSPDPPDAIIIGGIGGLSCAVGLSGKGVRVRLPGDDSACCPVAGGEVALVKGVSYLGVGPVVIVRALAASHGVSRWER
jgi:hypothetical protein